MSGAYNAHSLDYVQGCNITREVPAYPAFKTVWQMKLTFLQNVCANTVRGELLGSSRQEKVVKDSSARFRVWFDCRSDYWKREGVGVLLWITSPGRTDPGTALHEYARRRSVAGDSWNFSRVGKWATKNVIDKYLTNGKEWTNPAAIGAMHYINDARYLPKVISPEKERILKKKWE